MTTIEIKDIHWKVLYSHTQENNTIKITLEKAVKEWVDLHYAQLTGAYLNWADLELAKLKGAILVWARCAYVNLHNADLSEVNLACANLTNGELCEADLSKANLANIHFYHVNLFDANLTDVEGVTYEMLSESRALYLTRWIPEKIKERLMRDKPELFKL